MIVPVILAGGIGTRLWPLSRRERPKQFAKLMGSHTLFQDTISRVNSLTSRVTAPIIVCSDQHADLVLQQLHELQITDAHLILEPMGRNTAPAITVAALHAMKNFDDPILLVLPADHAIASVQHLHNAIITAQQYALDDYLMCFGVKPTRPETGYGYIKVGDKLSDNGGFRIERFVEKPNQQLAIEYLRSQQYYWNSGMFMFRAKHYLMEAQHFAGDIFASCQRVVEHAQLISKTVYANDSGNNNNNSATHHILSLDPAKFAACRSDSIDYAVMERTLHAGVVLLNAGWSDVGSWLSLWECGIKDEAENVVNGDVVVKDSVGSYVHATSRKVVAIGMENCIIVETPDAVLVIAKDKHQEIKGIAEKCEA